MAKAYDLVIVGGGIMGLWIARASKARGLTAAVIERGKCGNGASGTPLGALMPHLPGPTDARKDFHLAALATLEDRINRLEQQTGLPIGYRRCGRILPVRAPGFLQKMTAAAKAAPAIWSGTSGPARFEVWTGDDANPYRDWLAPSVASIGVAFETLSASVDPAGYIRALRASCLDGGTVIEQRAFATWDGGTARDRRGDTIARGAHLVLAAGWETYGLSAPNCEAGGAGSIKGGGVKGHALLVEVSQPMGDGPIIYDNGLYIVPRGDNRCAIGATTEIEWSNLDIDLKVVRRLHERAVAICPRLAGSAVELAWAGIRPRGGDREPTVGRLPGQPDVSVATGAYKISLALAHRVAEALVADIVGDPAGPDIPDAFRPDFKAAC